MFLSVLLWLLVALLPQLSLSKPKKKRGSPGRKSETLADMNIDTLMSLRHHILYVSSIDPDGGSPMGMTVSCYSIGRLCDSSVERFKYLPAKCANLKRWFEMHWGGRKMEFGDCKFWTSNEAQSCHFYPPKCLSFDEAFPTQFYLRTKILA